MRIKIFVMLIFLSLVGTFFVFAEGTLKTSLLSSVTKNKNPAKKRRRLSRKTKKLNKKETLAKKSPDRSVSLSANKEDYLPPNFYKPKKNEKELSQKLAKHLKSLEDVCELEPKIRKQELIQRLKSLRVFLKKELEDTYIIDIFGVKFGDILENIKKPNNDLITDLQEFLIAYRVYLNLPEDIKLADYPDDWAKSLHKSMDCE